MALMFLSPSCIGASSAGERRVRPGASFGQCVASRVCGFERRRSIDTNTIGTADGVQVDRGFELRQRAPGMGISLRRSANRSPPHQAIALHPSTQKAG